jgi:hypothetical protein
MNKTKLINKVTSKLKRLNTYKISLANDFLDVLESKGRYKPSEELFNTPGFYEKYLKALEETKKGKLVDFNSIKVTMQFQI